MTSLLKRADLACILSVSTRTLDRQRAGGLILDSLPGAGQPRWSAAEVQRWIEDGRPKASVWAKIRKRP
jgi:hypothetical protein